MGTRDVTESTQVTADFLRVNPPRSRPMNKAALLNGPTKLHLCPQGGCPKPGRGNTSVKLMIANHQLHGLRTEHRWQSWAIEGVQPFSWPTRSGSHSWGMLPNPPFGMTNTLEGARHARRTVFSLAVWLTQIAACTSARITCTGHQGWCGPFDPAMKIGH